MGYRKKESSVGVSSMYIASTAAANRMHIKKLSVKSSSLILRFLLENKLDATQKCQIITTKMSHAAAAQARLI